MLQFKNKVANWAFDLISFLREQIIVVYYIKRTTGEMRRMVCVWRPEFVDGYKNLRFDPTKKNLLTVWDIESGDWRFISMDAVKKITCSGLEFDWKTSRVALEDMHHAQIEEYETMISGSQDLSVPTFYLN